MLSFWLLLRSISHGRSGGSIYKKTSRSFNLFLHNILTGILLAVAALAGTL
jgi:hypothetical protein